jgi:hypothetical protein
MAGFNRKSTTLSGRDALPQVPASRLLGGREFNRVDSVTAVTADDTTSRYGFVSIPSGAIVKAVELSNDLATGAMSIGLFENTQNGGGFALTNAGGVANANQYFGTAVALAAAQNRISLLPVAAWQTVAKFTQMVWQILGLPQDPVREYDVVGSVTTTLTAGGVIMLDIDYKY